MLNERAWGRINRFLQQHGAKTDTARGVQFSHPKIPFTFEAHTSRLFLERPVEIDWYAVLEWRAPKWTARMVYVPPKDRHDGKQMRYEFEGDESVADQEMALALLSI